MKKELRYGLSILFFYIFSTISFGQTVVINPNKNLYGPTSGKICNGDISTIKIETPQKFVQYRLFNSLKPTPIDTTFPVQTDDTGPIIGPRDYSALSFSGADLNDGINILTVTGKGAISGTKVPNNLITIDGILNENYWQLTNAIQNMNPGHPGDINSPYSAVNFGILWDDNYLYVGIKVIDLTPYITAGVNATDSDDLEIYFDPYDSNINYWGSAPAQIPIKQIRVGYLAPPNTVNSWPNNRVNGILSATSTINGSAFISKAYDQSDIGRYLSGTGYIVEFAIKWQDFFENPAATVPGAGFTFGFDLGYNDNRFNINRTEQSFWGYDNGGNKWQNSSDFGSMTLLDPIAYPATSTLSGLAETFVGTVQVSIKKTLPDFDYGTSAFCSDATNIPVHINSGVSGGAFGTTVSGVTLNPSNGTITDLNDLTVKGIVPITYTVPDPNCPQVGVGLLTIVGFPTIRDFDYGSVPYCNDGSNVSRSVTGVSLTGGAFSTTVPSTIFSVDVPSGLIYNISPNANDTYIVKYVITPTGVCGGIEKPTTISFVKPLAPNFTVSSGMVCEGGRIEMGVTLNAQNIIIWEKKDQSLTDFTSFAGGNLSDDTTSDRPIASTYYRVKVSDGICPLQVSNYSQQVITTAPILINDFYYYTLNNTIHYGMDSTSICNKDKLIARVEGVFAKDGKFSSNFPSSVMDPVKGDLTLKNALPGIYTVNFSIAGMNGCPDDARHYDLTITSSMAGPVTSPIDNGNLCEGQVGNFVLNSLLGDSVLWMGRITEQTNNFTPLENSLNSTDFSGTFAGNNTWNVQAVVRNGECDPVASSNFITFSSNLPSLGGVVTSNNTQICQDDPLYASLTEKRGSVKWFYTMDTTVKVPVWKPAINTNSIDSLLITDALIASDKSYGRSMFYRAEVRNGNCDSSVSTKLKVDLCKQTEFPANALIPDASNANSEWNLESMRLSNDAIIKVFNRYGVEVYSDTGGNARHNWWRGGGLPAGTYWYYIEQGEGHSRKTGAITIIK